VPGEVLDFVAGQLGIADPAVVKRYTERMKTKSDHQQEIRRKYGLRDFVDAEAELADAQLQRLKWFCWHGNVFRALQILGDLLFDLDVEHPPVEQAKLLKAVHEFDS